MNNKKYTMSNMAKKGFVMMSLVAAVFSFQSCNKFLDELPDSRMELSSASDVSKLLVSSYAENSPAYLLELYSDNTDEYQNSSWAVYSLMQEEAYQWKDITDISEAESPQKLWNAYYTGVATCNQALEFIYKQDDQSAYSAQLGEALISRAYNMFMLANVFCQAYDPETANSELGLPYPLEPETEVGVKYDRGTLAQLYQKIDEDIQLGLKNVTSNYSQPKYHFTQVAAKAFAARFYLYYRQYDKAIEYATQVLGANPGNNLRDWTKWAELSMNDQFQPNEYVSSKNRANILLQTVYSLAGYLEGPSVAGSKYAHGNIVDAYETLESQGPWGSSQSVMAYSVFYHEAMSKYILRKIPYAFEYVDIQAGTGYAHGVYSIFNYDETLLVRAEAYALTGQYDLAVQDLNTELGAIAPSLKKNITLDGITSYYNSLNYYTPAQPTAKKAFHTSEVIESETQEPLLHCILHLRRIVTIHEGFRMQDVKRYGITIYRRRIAGNIIVAVTDSLTPSDPRRAVQLPLDVIDAGLTANPRN